MVELIAWIAGPWAAAQQTLWLAAPTVVLLVGLPSVFSTVGDKRQVIVATPGPVRVAIELFLHAAAVVGAWVAWPAWAAVVATVVVVAALVAGLPRTQWLMRGAPSADSSGSPR